jgi:acyl-coenzyme A synthetase/AMP-(fatty) acid ligase
MTFLEAIGRVDPDRSVFLGSKQHLTYGDLRSRAHRLLPLVRNERVALSTGDTAQALAIMAASDGGAQAIALLSPVMDQSTLSTLESAFATSLSVTSTDPLQIAEADSRADLSACSFARNGNTEWVISTSGTTAAPKLVGHTFESLTRTTRNDVERGRGQVWGMVYDYTRYAGLQVVLQSVCSGATLAQPDFNEPLESQIAFLASAGCTHLSATPTMWRKILLTGSAHNLELQQVTLGGEIADNRILAALSKTFSAARLTHIFASTEAGVGFSVNDRQAGFPANYLDDPPLGIDIDVRDDMLYVRNPMVRPEYLGVKDTFSEDGWVKTGDVVRCDGDRFLFCGRESGVINVGGDKVFPENVERVALEHKDVRIARAYSKANPIVGSLVALDVVVLSEVVESIQSELMAYMKERLPRHQVPAFIRVVDELDVASSGKIQRH